MILKELNLGHEVKCQCKKCKGTGIYVGRVEHDGLGVICYQCNGKGYYILDLNQNMQLVQDEKNGIVYIVNEGIIDKRVTLFDKLQKRDDVKYVIYSIGGVSSPNHFFGLTTYEANIIKYSEFLEGKLPLPITKKTCPGQLTQLYGHIHFKNGCRCGDFSDCSKYGAPECWNEFYGDAKTIEEKQKVLKRM